MEEWPKDAQGRLSKVFNFKNYRKSFAFVSQVAMLAEKENHHPEIILDYGKVTVHSSLMMFKKLQKEI